MGEIKVSYAKKIIETVTGFYEVSVKDIVGRSRKKELVKPRHIIAYLLREDLRESYPKIARRLGHRDHTTAIYAHEKVKKELFDKTSVLFLEIEAIRARIKGKELRALWTPKEAAEKNVSTNLISQTIPEIVSASRWKQMLEGAKRSISPVSSERENSMLEEWRTGKTLEQIGKEWKITRERARQIITKAIFREISRKMDEGLEIDVEEFLKDEKTKHETLRDRRSVETGIGRKVRENVPALKRWSRYYAFCRSCGTTMTPHRSRGLCQRCYGINVPNRKGVISEVGGKCEICGMDKISSFQKFGRDLYVTVLSRFENSPSKYLVLCRSCYLKIAGKNLAASRWRTKKISSERS